MTIEDEEKLSLLKEKIATLEALDKSKRKLSWIGNLMYSIAHIVPKEVSEATREYKDFVSYLKEKEKKEFRAKQFNQYEYFRDYIQNLPEYTIWKNAVFEKKGERCEKCGDTNRLEIHHIQSFHSIVRAYQTGKINKKRMEVLLWNVNNGQVLCKGCHSQIDSSIYRAQHNRK